MKHYKITIRGKVQGVFYRQSTKEKADELGIQGFVRNEPNGDVYAEAEGSVEQLDALVEWCRKGPSRAEVKSVTFAEGELKGFSSFIIQR